MMNTEPKVKAMNPVRNSLYDCVVKMDLTWFRMLGLFCLFSFLTLFLSCRNNIPKQAEVIRSDSKVEYKDPMFYLEGQLCQHLRTSFEDSKGNLWFGTNIYGLMRYDGDTLVYFSEEDGVGDGRINDTIEDENGHLWFATYNGLTEYDGSRFINHLATDSTLSNYLWDILQLKGGFILATSDGVNVFDGTHFSRFDFEKAQVKDTNTILAYDRVICIEQDDNGKLWFGTDGFGISIYEGTKVSFLTKADGLCDNNITDIFEYAPGDIWIATMFGGITRIKDGEMINYMTDGTLDGVEVSGFYRDERNRIWFPVENVGVYCYDGKNFIQYGEEDGLKSNGILTVLEDSQSRFWLGGWGGLFRMIDNKFVSVTKDGPWD